MTKEDKLLKIIEGLQDSIRKLESDRITVNEPFHQYPYHFEWAHPVMCQCWKCAPLTLTVPTITCSPNTTLSLGSKVNEVS